MSERGWRLELPHEQTTDAHDRSCSAKQAELAVSTTLASYGSTGSNSNYFVSDYARTTLADKLGILSKDGYTAEDPSASLVVHSDETPVVIT